MYQNQNETAKVSRETGEGVSGRQGRPQSVKRSKTESCGELRSELDRKLRQVAKGGRRRYVYHGINKKQREMNYAI